MMLVMQCRHGCSVHLCIPFMIPEGHAVNNMNKNAKQLRWEGSSGDHLVLSPAQNRVHCNRFLRAVPVKFCVLQEWRLHNFSRQTVPVFD